MSHLKDQLGYVYCTVNKQNGTRYVGQYLGEFDPKYLGSGWILKRAIKKYGREQFQAFFVKSAFDRHTLDILEKTYIAKARGMGATYNIRDGGLGSTFNGVWPMQGKKHSEETKRKYSETRLGKIQPKISESLRGEKNHRWGVPMSEETKKKIGEANSRNKGVKHGNYGKKRTPEQIEAMRQRTIDQELWKYNGPHSEATKQKIREKALARFASGFKQPYTEETRRKISEGVKRYRAEKKARAESCV